jgi:prolyl-tRNA synthetase
VWPESVAPFKVHLICLGKGKVKTTTDKIYKTLLSENIEVLYDDREDKSAGEKFAESDLMGIPYRVIVSERTIAKNSVELKERSKKDAKIIKISQLLKTLNKK